MFSHNIIQCTVQFYHGQAHCITNFQNSSSSENETPYSLKKTIPLSPLPALVNRVLLSISINVITPGTSNKWAHNVFVFYVCV